MPFCYNYQTTIKNFYINNEVDLKEALNYIDQERINVLKEKANILNSTYIKPIFTKLEKHCRRIERIETAAKVESDFNKIATNNSLEKLLLFVFATDPDFEAFCIYSSHNTIQEIKYAMNSTFGVYDPYLIKVEIELVKHLLKEEEKEKLNQEIEKRVYK